MEPQRRSLVIGVFAVLALVGFAALTILIRLVPSNTPDGAILEWATDAHAPGLRGFMEGISWLTDLQPRVALAIPALAALVVLRQWVALAATGVAFLVLVGPIEALDWGSGVVVGRIRPNGAPFLSFPSGHTLGTVVMFGFIVYLAARLPVDRITRRVVIAASLVPLLAVGPSRVYVGVHWPSDVLAAYLLGTAALAGFILVYEAAAVRLEEMAARRRTRAGKLL